MSLDEVLERVRGGLPRGRANARTVAALTDNPGCVRRRVIDAAGVRGFELSERLGFEVARGQSPFAIAAGNSFEARLKGGSGYALLVEALRPFVELPADLRVEDLKRGVGEKVGVGWLEARARRTREVLGKIARGDADAPHVVDHPVLVFALAGAAVFLEPDALAFRVGRQLELVEIKSYPIVDGQADPGKLAATGGQAAVYLLALRATLKELGFDPGLLRASVILVAPKNFGRTAVAHRVPLQKKTMALERVLRAVPAMEEVTRGLPAGFTFDVDPLGRCGVAERRAALDGAVRSLPMLYVPECLGACDMGRYCRSQAIEEDEPSRLGRAARDDVAGVETLGEALRIAREGLGPGEEKLADVGEALRGAHRALERARGRAPAECGVESRGRARRKSGRAR